MAIITGTSGDDNLKGTLDDDDLFGLAGRDFLAGGSGFDLLRGGRGHDLLKGEKQSDELFGEGGLDVLIGGDGHDQLRGGTESDTLSGGNGQDTLLGGAGRDVLREGGGNTYVLTDTELTMLDGTLHQKVTLKPEMPIRDDDPKISVIRISGMTGFITDVNVGVSFSHQDSSEVVLDLQTSHDVEIPLTPFFYATELANSKAFIDTVFDDQGVLGIEEALPPFTGRFRPLGFLGELNGFDANALYALAVSDDELSNQGVLEEWFLEITTSPYVDVLGSLEVAELTGNDNDNQMDALAFSGDADLRGLKGNDQLFSGGGDDTLNGGVGIDTLIGGAGNDLYVVNTALDVTRESVGGGLDTVHSFSNRVLRVNEENLSLLGNVAMVGIGNAQHNVIRGNAQNNTLNGGGGRDTLVGGLGNDTYIVDAAADVVREVANLGVDLVRSSVSYGLNLRVENLTLTGDANISAVGNNLGNEIKGNRGHNVIAGGSVTTTKADQFDSLTGGGGSDVFVLGNSTGVFYNDGVAGTTGDRSLAILVDFRSGTDRLRLHGKPGDYVVGASTVPILGASSLYVDTDRSGGFSGGDEVIAIFRGEGISLANVLNRAIFV